MALIDDLSAIQSASTRALQLVVLAQKTAVFSNDDSVQDADTLITLTAAQRQAFITRMGPLITIIKTRAALLP